MEERPRKALPARADAVETVSTGSLGLDIALGVGGLPRGRVVEVFGPEGSGRTTLALQVIAEVQRSGGTAAFVDAEHALDACYARKLGVNLDDLVLSQPYTGEEALETTEVLVRSNAVDIVAVDSVAALTPKAEIERAMDASQAGLQALLMWRGLRRLRGNIRRSNAIVVFVNQIRTKIGMFASEEVTIGGDALKCYASVRLDIRRLGSIRDGDEVTGNLTRVRVVKNEVAPSSARHNSRFCTGTGSRGKARSSSSPARSASSQGPAPAFGTRASASAKERATPARTSGRTRLSRTRSRSGCACDC